MGHVVERAWVDVEPRRDIVARRIAGAQPPVIRPAPERSSAGAAAPQLEASERV